MAESDGSQTAMVTAQLLLGMEFTILRELVLVYLWEVTMVGNIT